MRSVVIASLAMGGLATAAPKVEPDTLNVPDPEVKKFDTGLQLPEVPAFELPPTDSGFVDPRTLRVAGAKLLETEVKVKGYIVWIYDCMADLVRPGVSRAQAKKTIDADPTQCERPKFYLASTRDTPLERALWVVDVPRPPNKLEKTRLPKEELAAWPKVPEIKLGAYVVLTGTFSLRSPHNEANSDGLLVFKAIEPASPPKVSKGAAPAPSTPVPTAKPAVTPAPVAAPTRVAVDPKIVNISNISLAAGNKAHGQRNYVQAADYYRRATSSWDGNHLAWYGLGGALSGQGDWTKAYEAFARAEKLRPDSAMYEMWSGIASYEATVQSAREAQATTRGVDPKDVSVDLSTLSFDVARKHLDAALARDPSLWRAQYFAGRIHRAQGRYPDAAASFSAAIRANRKEQGPFIALGELYRKWDYTEQAITVTAIGTKELPQDESASDVFFVHGMAYDDQHKYDKAIPSFTRALELKPTNHKALFQRGQAYFKTKKYKLAKADLEAFVAIDRRQLQFAIRQAQQMLVELATKKIK